MRKKFFSVVIILLSSSHLFAQTQKVVADKIIAQVGDQIILKSDIDNAISDYERQSQDGNPLPADANCQFLQGQIIQKILALQAKKDSLPVSDEEVDAELDNQIRYFISQYGSQEVLEQVAGKTIYQMKEDFREPFKERKLADAMRSKIVDNVKITPTEVKEYFNKIPVDSLPFYESEVEVGQIVIYPKPNKDIDEYVTQQLLGFKQMVESGQKKFGDLAKIYSQDPGSKDNGGQYSINRNDKNLDPTFLAAAFKLKEGQVSPVIRSKFGLHIIQMVSRAGDDAVVRHILIIPSVTNSEITAAKNTLDSARSKIIAGIMNFGTAVNKYSEDESKDFTGGMIMAPDGSTQLTIDQLDKDMVVALKNMNPGDISQPQAYTDDRGKQGVRLVYLKSRTQPHRENLKDDYDRIAQRALEIKKEKALEDWFKQHANDFFIDVDKDFSSCENIKTWWAPSTGKN